MKSIFFSRFEVASQGGGGVRRFTQINDALSRRMNYTFETTRRAVKKWEIDSKWFGLKYRWYVSRYEILNSWKEDYRNYTEKLFHYGAEWAEKYRDNIESMEFVLVDDPIYFAPLIDMLHKKSELSIIAFIHNIESLSVEQVNKEKVMELFQFELALLKKCSLCVTISREETFLLKNLGINTFYFPYYPPEKIEYRMKQIREKRKNAQRKDILFVGTVNNRPTGKGLTALIDAWKEHQLYKTGHTLLIAGYGTEKYKTYAEDIKGIKFLGSIDDEVLDSLLADVLCSIVYQSTGSGALTRIAELLIAGVPILANSHAARSYYNISGIHEFNSFSDIVEIIKYGQLDSVDIGLPEIPSVERLIKAIMIEGYSSNKNVLLETL